MPVRAELQLEAGLTAWVRLDCEWQRVTLLSVIHDGGVVKNRVRDGAGNERVVRNDWLRFQTRKPVR